MIYNDVGQHYRPHVHVFYGEHEASISLDGEMLAGELPEKQFRIISGWLALHEEELYEAWNNAVQGKAFDKVEPIK